MRRINSRDQKGFTIIEVVLVLAIAGLIFLVVFLALPALQKSQRDNARKQDVAKVIAGLQQYMVDNGNNLPAIDWIGSTGYYTGLAQSKGVFFRPEASNCSLLSDDSSIIVVNAGCACDNTGTVTRSSRHAAVSALLDSGKVYCQDF